MKKGFTLIEVLIVLVIISIVSASSVILFNESLNAEKIKNREELFDQIEIAADVYFFERDTSHITSTSSCVVSINSLQNANLIDEFIKDPVTNAIINSNACVCGYKDASNNYVYEFYNALICD